jgi:hypothetical protein
MKVSVQILAQVPAEARCLPETLASVASLGPLTLYDCSGDPGITAAANAVGVRRIEIGWRHDLAACFNEMLADLPGASRLLVHADEVVEGEIPDDPFALAEGEVATILVRHRTSSSEFFDEEREVRYAPPGDLLSFDGRFPADPRRLGVRVAPDDLQPLPIVLAHYPDKWPGLAEQRIRRTIGAVEAALAEAPEDIDHLYALLHCHVSLHDWPRVAELAGVWHAAAGAADARSPLVRYHEACAMLRSRDVAGAERLLNEAVEQAPAFGDAWFLLAELARVRGRQVAARKAFEHAASLGLDAHPVAVEDHSLTTWRPFVELASLAEKEGRDEDAARLREIAETRRVELLTG